MTYNSYPPERIQEIETLLIEYIDNNEIPILAEFASCNNIPRSSLYDLKGNISTLIKKCTEKKEAALERKALNNDVNVTMAIFSLKQMGWSDKKQLEHSGDMGLKIEVDFGESEN